MVIIERPSEIKNFIDIEILEIYFEHIFVYFVKVLCGEKNDSRAISYK